MEMQAISSISRPKVPKGFSYVLRSGQLDEFLISGGFTVNTTVRYWLPQTIGSIFEAHYWMPNVRAPYYRLYIKAGALPKDDIQKARILLTDEVFPQFAMWLEALIKCPEHLQNYAHSQPYFNAVYEAGEIRIVSR